MIFYSISLQCKCIGIFKERLCLELLLTNCIWPDPLVHHGLTLGSHMCSLYGMGRADKTWLMNGQEHINSDITYLIKPATCQ